MNIHELRIWNYVRFCGAESIITAINNNNEENPYVDLASYYNIPIEDLHPITLTEEWLLKFGFIDNILKLNKNNIGNSRYFTGIKYYSTTKETYLIVNDDKIQISKITLFSIKYVHQLQNLYFALTGEELTIK